MRSPCLAALAFLPLALPAASRTLPAFEVTALPELAGSTSVALDVSLSGTLGLPGAVSVTGWSTDAQGIRKAVVWTGSGVPFQWEETEVLPPITPDRDCWAIAGSDPLWPPNHKVGAALDAGGIEKPVLWTRTQADTAYQAPVILPTLAGGTGEVLAITSGPDPLLAGHSTTGSGVEKACKWSRDNGSVWRIATLPHYGVGLSGRALGLCQPDTLCFAVVGYCVSGAGDTLPQFWESPDGGITWSRTALPLLPGGTHGQAAEIIITHTNFFTAAGWCDTPGGDRRVTRWESADGQTWSVTDLGAAPGLPNSTIGDIVLPEDDLFEAVGRSWDPATPSSGKLTLWLDAETGAAAHDLNDLVVGTPGLDLRIGHGFVYDHDNILRIVVGDGTDLPPHSPGRPVGPHALVAMQVGATGARAQGQSAGPGLRLAALPNPFSESTALSFVVPAPVFVRLTVCDVAGRTIATLMEGEKAPGRHDLSWAGHDDAGRPVPPGVYFARLYAGGRALAEKLVRVR